MADVTASDGYEAVGELEPVDLGVIVLDGRRAVARVLEKTRQVCLTSLPTTQELCQQIDRYQEVYRGTHLCILGRRDT